MTALEKVPNPSGIKLRAGGKSGRGSHHLSLNFTCPRAYELAFHEGLRGIGRESWYMDYGTLVHARLAYYYAPRMERKPEWYTECPDGDAYCEQLARELRLKQKDVDSSKALTTAYANFDSVRGWEVLYAEEEFKTTVGKILPGVDPELVDEPVTCRPDLIIRTQGSIYIVDHKTTGGDRRSGRVNPIDDPRYGWQKLVNLHVVRAAGVAVDGFLFNFIKRDMPYDFGECVGEVSDSVYEAARHTIVESVRIENGYKQELAAGNRLPMRVAHCQSCSFREVCWASSPELGQLVKETSFRKEG